LSLKEQMTKSLIETLTAIEAHLHALRETDPGPLNISRKDISELTSIPPSPAATPPGKPLGAPAKKTIVSSSERPSPSTVQLSEIAARIAVCTRCPLQSTRTKTVPGQGHPQPELLFIGEGPGSEEDQQGLAFVGRSGALLTRLIERMGLARDQVFIANMVKCRPTEKGEGRKDRPPAPEEIEACLPYLRQQIAVLRPKVIISLGNVALEGLTGLKGITRLRGKWLKFETTDLMPTYHPSFLLRGGGDDKARYWEVWDDMCEVLRRISRPVPEIHTRRPES